MSGGLPQRYRVYGLALDSEVPLLGVQRRDDQTAGLIRISCTAPPAGALRDLVCLHEAPGRGQVAEPPFSILRSTSSGWTVWRWQDGITFSLSPDGRSVHAGLPAGETEASLAYYLVGRFWRTCCAIVAFLCFMVVSWPAGQTQLASSALRARESRPWPLPALRAGLHS